MVKLVLEEPGSVEAAARSEEAFSSGEAPATLDLAMPEALNALWKHYHIHGDLTRETLFEAASDLRDLYGSFRVLLASPLAGEAIRISAEYGVSPYDSLYVAAARVTGFTLLTDDRKLWKAAHTLAKIQLLVE